MAVCLPCGEAAGRRYLISQSYGPADGRRIAIVMMMMVVADV
jgi:hypothetical protein